MGGPSAHTKDRLNESVVLQESWNTFLFIVKMSKILESTFSFEYLWGNLLNVNILKHYLMNLYVTML